ncbi:MAG TPA: hypothetical protein P5511_02625, partial [Candidatus Goldiibacteriota bacterium]|nr:hypothetical protein [Candidatus Goldiibacteriota bacterium]
MAAVFSLAVFSAEAKAAITSVMSMEILGDVIAGNTVTVRFTVTGEGDGKTVFASIIFSRDDAIDATDDALLTDSGVYDSTLASPENDGYSGADVGTTVFPDPKVVDVILRIPSNYYGNYYIFIAVSEETNFTINGGAGAYEALGTMTVEVLTPSVTPTVTETSTVTPTVTETVTPTVTETYTVTETVTDTVTPTVTETVTPTVTETYTVT